jgi:simple sugar transport system ATP-binding protein
LVPTLSVRENLLLGAAKSFGGPLSYPASRVVQQVQEIAERLGWRIPWDTPAGQLPVGAQQRVEILKALRGQARLLIFDEPTAVLTPTETPELFATIRQLAGEGRGVVFISHKLDEVTALANRVTVLRRGRVVHKAEIAQTTTRALAEAMVGQGSEAGTLLARQASPVSRDTPAVDIMVPSRLTVQNINVHPHHTERFLLWDVTFDVVPGEIFGIAGVDGNGQAELAEVLSGLRRPDNGRVLVDNQAVPFTPLHFRHAGVSVIPADRHKQGLALPMNITENVAFGVYDKAEFRRGPLLLWPKLQHQAENLIARFDIRAESPRTKVVALSGGNQQKVVIARALSQNPKVVVAVNPTRGLDVGAIAYVHEALRRAQAGGAAIVLISTELDEVLTLSNRVAVLFDGKLSPWFKPDLPREQIGSLMGGQE